MAVFDRILASAGPPALGDRRAARWICPGRHDPVRSGEPAMPDLEAVATATVLHAVTGDIRVAIRRLQLWPATCFEIHHHQSNKENNMNTNNTHRYHSSHRAANNDRVDSIHDREHGEFTTLSDQALATAIGGGKSTSPGKSAKKFGDQMFDNISKALAPVGNNGNDAAHQDKLAVEDGAVRMSKSFNAFKQGNIGDGIWQGLACVDDTLHLFNGITGEGIGSRFGGGGGGGE